MNESDAFNDMRDMLANGTQFDVVILDPPKLIRSRAEIEVGTRKHFELNRLAMRLVKPGGMLLSSYNAVHRSCRSCAGSPGRQQLSGNRLPERRLDDFAVCRPNLSSVSV